MQMMGRFRDTPALWVLPCSPHPSIIGDYANALRTVEEEHFAVATMLFMILITGQFPYARAGADGGDFATLIREGKFAFQFQGSIKSRPARRQVEVYVEPSPAPGQELFWNTFQKEGGSRYDRRPTAGEWLAIFREYRSFFGSADDFDPNVERRLSDPAQSIRP